ncbi:MAG TPA: DUF2127 domain-containing protein [Candidatus Sulfotelmatobacter sp.]|nr:DUF2127 domain-containing protein [Candidatus Sulfotelmatobacter sp.]
MTNSPAKLRRPEKPALEHAHRRAQKQLLRAVASFEFTKGVFVIAMGLCALLLVHKDAWLLAESLLALLHINPDRRSAQMFLDFADKVTDARLWTIASVAFTYGALRFTEAYGLWRQRAWAEWIAFVSGTAFLPLEVRELFRGITALRVVLFIGNLAIVLYMFFLLRDHRRERRKAAAASAPLG